MVQWRIHIVSASASESAALQLSHRILAAQWAILQSRGEDALIFMMIDQTGMGYRQVSLCCVVHQAVKRIQ